MNQLGAMRDTIALMDERLKAAEPMTEREQDRIFMLDADLQPEHLRDMLAVMERGVNPQDTERDFSEAKLGRWLGWAQAAVVAMGLATLDDMKNINRKWAGK